jgi:hypothetical protein
MARFKEQAIAFYSALTVIVAVQAVVAHSAIAAGSDYSLLYRPRPVDRGAFFAH